MVGSILTCGLLVVGCCLGHGPSPYHSMGPGLSGKTLARQGSDVWYVIMERPRHWYQKEELADHF